MINISPGKMIGIGFVLVLAGVVVPFLMVMHLLPSTFLLNILSFVASISGLIMGTYGSAMYVREHRKKH